jgi:uncharacterized protein YvpB
VLEVSESIQERDDSDDESESQVKGANEIIQSEVSIKDQVKLSVPLIKQIYSLSCEVASLEMALKYFDINTSQDKLLDKLGVSEPFKMQTKNGQIIWGDPDEAFVGDVKGWFTGKDKMGVEKLELGTGWGVNSGPIERVAKIYLPNSYKLDNAKIEDIDKALSAGSPVLWWHIRPDSFEGSIKTVTQDGKSKNFTQMHVAVITGYKTVDGERIYTINDPYFEQLQLSQKELLRQWALQDNQMVVVAK